MSQEVLEAQHPIEYTYTRSTGPVIGAFMTALRDRRIVGVRASDGRVLVPPAEYDPVTSEDLSEIVDVADEGGVADGDHGLAGGALDLEASIGGHPKSPRLIWRTGAG